MVGREPSRGRGNGRGFSQNPLDRVRTGALPEARPANRGDLVRVERRILALEVNNRLADGRGQPQMPFPLRRWREAGHAQSIERVGLAIEGALGDARGLRADRRGQAEEDDRANEFVGALRRRLREELELLPIVRRGDL